MSTAPELATERGLPTPVSNLLTSWWLAIAFAGLSALLLWRDLPWGGSLFGWILLFLLLAVMAAIGIWVGRGVSRGNPGALGRCKLLSLVGTGLGLLAVVGFVIIKFTMPSQPADTSVEVSYMGAANLFLVGSLLAALVLPPLLFGLFTWSLSMQDEVERFFYPPAEAPAEEEAAVAAVVDTGDEEFAEAAEVVTAETPELAIVDNSSVGTLMAEDASVQDAIEAQEARLADFASTAEAYEGLEGAESAEATPTDRPFSTGSLELQAASTDPFATSSATGRKIEKLAQQAQRLDPDAITEDEGSVAEAVEASELLSITEPSESVSADVAEDGSESVLLADEDASALLASAVDEQPKPPQEKSLPAIPSSIDEPLSVGDMELTFDEEQSRKDQ